MDKVRRLLDDLSRRGSNAYHGFLWALRNAGYDFLASKIVENEKIVRREIEEKEREKRKKSEERGSPMQTATNIQYPRLGHLNQEMTVLLNLLPLIINI